jgi:tetratricopeptide (TPR) repeat protein
MNFIFLELRDIVLSFMQCRKLSCAKLFVFLFLSVFLFSCQQKEEKLSKEEALQVARNIDSTIRQKQPKYFNELLEVDLFTKKIAKATSGKNSKALTNGIKSAWRQIELGDKIIQGLGETGHYQLVKHYEKEGVHHLVYRLYSTEGLNYHDIELAKYKGEPRITDIYIYLSGENFSTTISELAKTFAGSFDEDEGSAMSIPASINKIRDFMKAGDYEKAEKYYKELPENIKNQRSVRLIGIMIYKDFNDEEYLKQLENFKTSFPDAPNVDLLMIDAYIIRKDFAKAIESIDKLDRFINKDLFLDYFRGLISNLADKPDEALPYFENLNKNFPQFGDGVLELIAHYITNQKNEEAAKLIKVYKANKDFNQQMLESYLSMQPQFEY